MNDTICALATATGGALGIIRVSGPQTFDAVSAICAVKCADCAPNTSRLSLYPQQGIRATYPERLSDGESR